MSGDWLALLLEASAAWAAQGAREERRRDRPSDIGRCRCAVPGSAGAAAASAAATPGGCGCCDGERGGASLAAGGVSTASSNASTCTGGRRNKTTGHAMVVAFAPQQRVLRHLMPCMQVARAHRAFRAAWSTMQQATQRSPLQSVPASLTGMPAAPPLPAQQHFCAASALGWAC